MGKNNDFEVNKQRNGDIGLFNLPFSSLSIDFIAPGLDAEIVVAANNIGDSRALLKGPQAKKLLQLLAKELGFEVVPEGTQKELVKLRKLAAKGKK